MSKILFKKLYEDAIVPTFAHRTDSGLDLYAIDDYELPRNVPVMIRTGIACQLPPFTEGQIRPRGSTSKRGILISLGTTDEGYTGELIIIAMNLSHMGQKIQKGERVAQLVVVPIERPWVEVVSELSSTDRNSNGFGSTGR